MLLLYTLNTQYSLVDSLVVWVDKFTSALPFPFFPEVTENNNH